MSQFSIRESAYTSMGCVRSPLLTASVFGLRFLHLLRWFNSVCMRSLFSPRVATGILIVACGLKAVASLAEAGGLVLACPFGHRTHVSSITSCPYHFLS
jgi:hypothetical protein